MKKTFDIVKRFLNKYSKLKSAYTLAEVVVVMLVVAVVVSVSIKITKVKLDNIISYTYYSGYSTLRNVTGQVLADFKSTDDEYLDKEAMIMPKTLLSLIMPLQKAFAGDKKVYFVPVQSMKNSFRYSTFSGTSYTPVGYYSSLEELIAERKDYITQAYLDSENPANGDWYTKCPGTVADFNLIDWPSYAGKYSSCTEKCYDQIIVNMGYGASGKYKDVFNRPSICGDTFGEVAFKCVYYAKSTGGYDSWKVKPAPGNSWQNLDTEPQFNGQYYYCEGYTEDDDTPEPDPNVCTTPSEAEQEVHRCQNQEEWKGEPTCGYVPITCPEGNHWSVNSCGCVPESPTLPRKGINFCRKFVSYTNTKSNSPECTGTAITSTETDFSDKTADITLRNGMRIYNMSQNPQEIGILEGNTQGASYDGVPNINTFGYTVYLDIDGEKGSSTLWEDVYIFYITMAGKVIPAYDENNPNEEVGGNSRRHLMTSVERETIVDGRRQMRWLKKSVSFKEGACTSNYLGASSRYCNGVNLLPDCNDPINPCLMKHVSPVKFF